MGRNDSGSETDFFPNITRRAICGNWQQEYSLFHSNALVDFHQPKRFAIAMSVESGLGDNIVGLISIFFYALMSRRIFTTYSYDSLSRFEFAFDQPNVNWTFPHRLPDEAVEPMKYTYKGVPGYRWSRAYNESLVNTTEYAQIYLVNDNPNSDIIFQRSNLSMLPMGKVDVPYVLAASNRGRSFKLFDNPYHRNDLMQKMGLSSPSSAFSCAFSFLFRPNLVMRKIYGDLWRRLSESDDEIKIGIRIRVGDAAAFDGKAATNSRPTASEDEALLSKYMHYFRCAEEIEQELIQERNVTGSAEGRALASTWYLISDSLELRQAAQRHFGVKLLTDDAYRPMHTYCPVNSAMGLPCGSNQEERMREATVRAAGDLLSFALTDYHIFSRESGFGRVGAWL
eukprot:gene23631-30642_t